MSQALSRYFVSPISTITHGDIALTHHFNDILVDFLWVNVGVAFEKLPCVWPHTSEVLVVPARILILRTSLDLFVHVLFGRFARIRLNKPLILGRNLGKPLKR